VYDESYTTPTATHVWTIPGNYMVTLRVTDNSSATATKTKTITITDLAPPAPTVNGPTSGSINHVYDFTVGPIIDPEEDSFYCKWDWGDGNISDWAGPYPSGQIASGSHSWTAVGTYEIRARLKDSYGAESNWSEPLVITITNTDFSIDIRGGFGVTATIKNIGGTNVTDIQWTMTLTGGLVLLGKTKSGTAPSLEPNATTSFKDSPILGIGKTTIQVNVTCAEGVTITKSATGTVFLFFVLGVQ
jgi:PKD repeat protein